MARMARKLVARMKNEPIDFVKDALVCDYYVPGLHVDVG
jgi:hypothetical protein